MGSGWTEHPWYADPVRGHHRGPGALPQAVVLPSDLSTGETSVLIENAQLLSGLSVALETPPVWNGQSFFATGYLENSYEIWITDGTFAGTRMLIDLSPNPSTNFVATSVQLAGDHLVIAGVDGDPTTGEQVGDARLITINLRE